MTKDPVNSNARRIESKDVKYDPSTLTSPVSANFVDVSNVNGTVYIDFGYLEYLVSLDKVTGLRSKPVQLVSRVALSPQNCMQLVDILIRNLQGQGFTYVPGEGEQENE